MPQHQGRRNVDEQLLLSLACGHTIDSIAAKLKISPSTIHRHLKDAKFQKRLREVRNDMVGRATSMLTAAAMEAVKTLLALQAHDMPPPVRLGAARSILELGAKLRESLELNERITALEMQLGGSA